MTKQGLTHAALILDRSGSMQRIKSDMEGALNTFINTQQQVPGDCTVSLYLFDDLYEPAWENVPLANVPSITIEPRGSTSLRDALGKTINRLGNQFREMPEDQRPEKVLVVTITDGLENSSREYTSQQVREMIKHQEEKYGWAFTYLGANQDAFLVAGEMGIDLSRTSNYGANAKGTQALSTSLNAATTRMRGAVGQSASSSYGYTGEEQEAGDQSVTSP